MKLTQPLVHKDGISWHEAPKPRFFHRCKPWTTGGIDFDTFERCACGAIRRNGKHWDEKNSRGKR